MSSTIYYVYAYINSKTGKPYYIGKGNGGRAYSKDHCVSVPKDRSMIYFCETNLTEVGAYALERRLIRLWGRKGIEPNGILYNIQDGGQGQCPYFTANVINKNPEKIRKTAEKHRGMKRSKEAKEKMSLAKKGKPAHNRFKYHTPYGIFETREEASEAINLKPCTIYSRCVGSNNIVLTKVKLRYAYDVDKELAIGKTWKELGWYHE